jgi:hypothetical protein
MESGVCADHDVTVVNEGYMFRWRCERIANPGIFVPVKVTWGS